MTVDVPVELELETFGGNELVCQGRYAGPKVETTAELAVLVALPAPALSVVSRRGRSIQHRHSHGRVVLVESRWGYTLGHSIYHSGGRLPWHPYPRHSQMVSHLSAGYPRQFPLFPMEPTRSRLMLWTPLGMLFRTCREIFSPPPLLWIPLRQHSPLSTPESAIVAGDGAGGTDTDPGHTSGFRRMS